MGSRKHAPVGVPVGDHLAFCAEWLVGRRLARVPIDHDVQRELALLFALHQLRIVEPPPKLVGPDMLCYPEWQWRPVKFAPCSHSTLRGKPLWTTRS